MIMVKTIDGHYGIISPKNDEGALYISVILLDDETAEFLRDENGNNVEKTYSATDLIYNF